MQRSVQFQLAFHCYLAAPWPTLDHCWGGNLNNLMLITALYSWFYLKDTGNFDGVSKVTFSFPRFVSACTKLAHLSNSFLNKVVFRAGLHESRSELKLVWNLKPLWKVVTFTCQFYYGQPWDLKPLSKVVPFTWRFHCGNFSNHSKILMHMHRW